MTALETKQYEITQDETDARFAEIIEKAKDVFSRPETELLETERDMLLSELLERNPHEALAEIVHSLRLQYRNRSVTTYDDDVATTMFATRNDGELGHEKPNSRLDDIYTIIESPEESATLIGFGDFSDMGHEMEIIGDTVRIYVRADRSHRVLLLPDEIREDGQMNNYDRTLREFYLRALKTAGKEASRRHSDPVAAQAADTDARAKLFDLIASSE